MCVGCHQIVPSQRDLVPSPIHYCPHCISFVRGDSIFIHQTIDKLWCQPAGHFLWVDCHVVTVGRLQRLVVFGVSVKVQVQSNFTEGVSQLWTFHELSHMTRSNIVGHSSTRIRTRQRGHHLDSSVLRDCSTSR